MAGKANHRAFGYVRKLPSGKYQASYIGPDSGRHTAPTTYTTKARAEGWLAKELAKIERREWISPKAVAEAEEAQALVDEADALPLGEYATDWLSRRRELKPRTRSDYERLLARHIMPTIGQKPIKALTPADVNSWYLALNSQTPTERAHAFQLLRTILNSAVREDLIDKSPCRIQGAGTVKRAKVIEPATLEQLSTIVAAMPERLRAAVLLASWCALRYGEIAELRRKDIDQGVVHVRRGVTWVGGSTVIGTPKTEAGVRVVHLPPHIVGAISEHLDKHVKPGVNSLLFPAANGEHMHPRTFGKIFNKARTEAGRNDLTFHGLRHTGAVLAAQSGATIAELQGRLGHSTASAAMRYQHAAEGRDLEIARRLSALAEGR